MFDVADRLFAAIAAGDVDGVAACYAPDAVIWHNFDGVEQPAAANLEVLRWLVTHVSDIRYEIVRRIATDDGFVQQHVLHGRTRDGTPLRVPACLIVTVRDGHISRIDEYLDTAQLSPLIANPTRTEP
jgi:ketosteroid isomerase-like protein